MARKSSAGRAFRNPCHPKIPRSQDQMKTNQNKTSRTPIPIHCILYPSLTVLYKLHQMDDIISLLLLTEEIVYATPNVDPPPLHPSPTQACQIPETS
jgi:hypothetical protein